ncbi:MULTISPECIES: hypothetical protein [Romboutsia]|uniref:hypothetical protein n=1 Tax=Romboutsia TaxID=1501226 RepID=UPI000B88DEDC|nr:MULTISPECIES: hypothetical protein [Romboutsia]MCH1959547.1 hypothetical protein [Romboutsia hominis]MCH1970031.1 hypothetical protein [Romboutsia hominis]MDB8791209.1 hypothetical protein [Romboutsia sp. 1001216sp1]MDB8800780.1 hypothetical protein [Romboutsia sp. 1001216sp1]MDB8803938.1 hypothetical protein [Romboutsia sp. 1001216sp1]
MNKSVEKLKEVLPKKCCSYCTHLSLYGPDENYKYNIKCILLDSLPNLYNDCDYFECEYSNLTSFDLDNLYSEYLEACLKVKYKEYLNSIHWQIFKDYALRENDYTCSICGQEHNLDVYHINKNLGRETLEDVAVLCDNCLE